MAARQKESVSLLKQKVEELEKQVADYKKRLDDLRKAKNTTITKREREVLEVGGPNFGKRESDGRVADLEKKLEAAERRRQDEVAALEKRLDAQLRLQESLEQKEKVAPCDHEGFIMVLQADNNELREQVENLTLQLSIKEAQWCEAEEKLKQELKASFGEKYAEWMAATEQKLEELRHANNVMRQMLTSQRSPAEDAS